MKLVQHLAGLVAICWSFAAFGAPTHSIRVKFVTPDMTSTTTQQNAVDVADPVESSPSVTETAAAVQSQDSQQVEGDARVDAQVHPVSPPVAPARTWRVDPVLDRNVRLALARWAADAGWTFTPELWELPHDLPLTAPATLATTNDFTEAAQALAEAVAQSDTPFRVCFYPNKVLRALPYNAVCDRSSATPH